jgi:hypothetical protein
MLESKQAKNLTMTIREAKDLHGDITKLLLALHEIRNAAEATESDEVQTIEITGGDFK